MTDDKIRQNKMTYDILKELFNISVGKAADMLSDIVNQKIFLNVPDVEIINVSSDSFQLEDFIPEKIKGMLMVSSISFQESYTGKANLIFPAEKMKRFVSLCLQEENISSEIMDFNDVDFDIIKEIGNIILNCIMGETGNFLQVNFKYSLPEVKIFDRNDFNNDLKKTGYMHILILYITFVIGDTEIEGAIIVDLTLNSLNDILLKINEIEDLLYD
jgi:Chemotaxis protein CheC, inhibitor of MCP methylation